MHDRRWVLRSCLAIAAAVSSRDAWAQQSGSPPGMAAGTMTLQECVQSCLKSHSMCLETAWYVTQRGPAIPAAHMALLLDCAEMCQTTANSLLRRSPQHAVVCDACARLCDACAQDCERVAADEQMRQCAATCRECAKSCRDMARVPL